MITPATDARWATLLAPYRLAESGSDPAGCVLAPDTEDDLPSGESLGEIETAEAPQGCRSVAGRIHGAWDWRITSGEGVTVRQGKGPARGSGTRPKLRILEPCRSVALRADGTDEAFPFVRHHVVIVWVQPARTGRWGAEGAWAWSCEPAPAGDGRAWARPPRKWKTIGEVAALLYVAPSAQAMAALHAPRDAAALDYAMALPEVKR